MEYCTDGSNDCVNSSVENNNNTNTNNNNKINRESAANLDFNNSQTLNINSGKKEDGTSKDEPSSLRSSNLNEKKKDANREKGNSKVSIGPVYIPPHLMGRDINNPEEDVIGTGRHSQKPRLGVKVPYRNLTSQIVSQDEIAQEILEQSLRKHSYDVPERGDLFFAMELTRRFANKISVNCTDLNNQDESSSVNSKVSSAPDGGNQCTTSENNRHSKTESKKNVQSTASSQSADVAVKSATMTGGKPSENNKSTAPKMKDPSIQLIQSVLSKDERNNSLAGIAKCANEKTGKSIASKIALNESVITKVYNSVNHVSLTTSSAAPSKTNVKNEMDNETLLAILEGTAEVTDILPPTTKLIDVKPVSSQQQQTTPKRKKKLDLDSQLAKELALKQLEAFENDNKKRRKSTNESANKRLKQPVVNSDSGNQRQSVSDKNVAGTADASVDNQTTVDTSAATSNNLPPVKKLIKRRRVAPYKSESAPKRLPKKYQRIIKKQMRNSKLKSKNITNGSPDVQQKKLPEVPEVRIAIDQYIKTYTNKRKHKAVDSAVAAKPALTNSSTPEKEETLGEPATAVVENKTDSITPIPSIDVAPSESDADISIPLIVSSTNNNAIDESVSVNTDETIIKNDSTTTVGCDANSITDSGQDVVSKSAANEERIESASSGTGAVAVTEAAAPIQNNVTASPPKKIATRIRKNTKMMREINRLLGDEGAINMIYSVEQKRNIEGKVQQEILPSLRRKKKDLLLKTKLVKNAVLRLSMSPNQIGSARVCRKKSEPSASSPGSKKNSQPKSPPINAANATTSQTSPTSSPVPLRKLAADDSKIIRRHSTSSSSGDEEHESSNSADTPVATPVPAAAVTAIENHEVVIVDDMVSDGKTDSDEIKTVSATSKQSSSAAVESSPEVVLSDSPSNDQQQQQQTSAAKKNVANINQDAVKAVTRNAADKVYRNKSKAGAKDTGNAQKPNSILNKNFEKLIANDYNQRIIDSIALIKKSEDIEDVVITRYNTSLVKVIITSESAKMRNALNIPVMKVLINTLNNLQNDSSCKVVLVTSTGGYFCQGIDMSVLVCTDLNERKSKAQEFANVLGDFIKCLANFPKPLIAGVQGGAIGIGVTILPYFDIIFASDKATFQMLYSKLGQIPEGAAILTLPPLLGTAVTNELLFSCRKLTAMEAVQFGLITRILWPDKFGENLVNYSLEIAKHSLQSLESMKMLLRRDMRAKLDDVLKEESTLLVEHWCSEECQKNFTVYLRDEAVLSSGSSL